MLLKLFKFGFVAFSLIFFIVTYLAWPGLKYTYFIFSVSFFLLILFALKYRVSAGYVFLGSVLWIGFWLKLSIHILEPALTWMEPVGLFDFSKDAWDEVAIVSSVGALGILVGGLYCFSLKKIATINQFSGAIFNRFRVVSWAIGLIILSCMLVINEKYRVIHSPIPEPVLDIPLHLQGLFNWYLGGGWALLLMIPLYLEYEPKRSVRAMVFVLAASLAVSVSIFSRGTVVIESITFIAAYYVYRTYLPKYTEKELLQVFMVMCLCIVLSVSISQARRQIFFSSLLPVSVQPVSVPSTSVPSTSVPSTFSQTRYSLFLILKLPIERWIGLESVMAMSAHPGKGKELLLSAISEQRIPGVIDSYTHDIALSPSIDTKTVIYATPPSLFAFWYYSGSMLVVFIAAILFTILLVASEKIIFQVSRNPFLAAAIGIGVAIQIIHIGTGGLMVPAEIFATSMIVALLVGILSRYYLIGRQN